MPARRDARGGETRGLEAHLGFERTLGIIELAGRPVDPFEGSAWMASGGPASLTEERLPEAGAALP